MKLIDADKLLEKLGNYAPYEETTIFYFAHMVEREKEVEAIPVSWIEEWITKNEHTNRYDITDVEWLIKDWRKENE